jgi:cytochrome d ubiquinol oxidase subunit I
MLLAAFLTTGMCVAATGALLRGKDLPESGAMLRWGLGLVAVIIPVQMAFGHLTGIYVLNYQPTKFATIDPLLEGEMNNYAQNHYIFCSAGSYHIFL